VPRVVASRRPYTLGLRQPARELGFRILKFCNREISLTSRLTIVDNPQIPSDKGDSPRVRGVTISF